MSSWLRSGLAAAGALTIGALGLAAAAGNASALPRQAAPRMATPGVATGSAQMSLVDQSPFVENNQNFHLALAVSAPNPGTRLEVDIYQRLVTRTDFDSSMQGKLHAYVIYVTPPQAVSSLPADPAGGVDVDIPVDPTTQSGSVPPLRTTGDSGVYPVQVRLLDDQDRTLGNPLNTFLVYTSPASMTAMGSGEAGSSPAGTPSGPARLAVALTVPVHEPPSLTGAGKLTRLDPVASSTLSTLVATLSKHTAAPVTVAATPQTLDALVGGTTADRATLADLSALVITGGEGLAGQTYVSVSMPAMVAAGLGSEVTAQMVAGAAALVTDLHRRPTVGTWTVNGPLDSATLGSLAATGISQLVVPSGDLSALPNDGLRTTLAVPTELTDPSGAHLKVIGADSGLDGHFVNGGDQVLAANQLLAELAMIQTEAPSQPRGVAVLPPAGWQENPTFLGVVLKGLTGNPLLAPMTTENLFSSVPEISSSAGPIVRSLTGGRPPASAFSDAAIVRSARVAESAVGSVFPGDQTRMAALTRQVLTSESADLNADQRAQVAGVVTAAFGQLRHLISLPGASSITLTARDGGVPITVVANGAAGANVQLRLSSDKLSFRPFLPPGGHCVTPSAGVELCNLTLSSEATTLTVPVVARTSGVFSLDVSLSTPDGKISLSDTSDTVRSTAFSGVGVVLIVVAGFGLAYWWIRNIRHGRRARDLVPAGSGTRGDTDDDIYYDLDGDHLYRGHFEGGHTWSDDEDRMIAEFFSSPPPVYPPPPSQPDLPGR